MQIFEVLRVEIGIWVRVECEFGFGSRQSFERTHISSEHIESSKARNPQES